MSDTKRSGAALLDEQIAYYRARAGEYDDWWFRRGRFDRGALPNAAWNADVAAVEGALDAWLARHRPSRVLEFACGTGLFTRRLAPRAREVVAIDASPEVIALNRARVAAANVDYVLADIFEWEGAGTFDLVFMSFWLSHVPDERFASFWDRVRARLKPAGVAYLIDSVHDPTSTARDHAVPSATEGVVTRKLNDGRSFRVVKIFHTPDGLAGRLSDIGWNAKLGKTARYFVHGTAQPRVAQSEGS